MKYAFITLSNEGAHLIKHALSHFTGADAYYHELVDAGYEGKRFSRIALLTNEIWAHYAGLIFMVPCGVVVRSIDGLIKHKLTDPAVVVVDAGGRFAISLLSGHEGGANALAVRVANAIGAEPVVTTTTDALKSLIVGIGCRKDTPAEKMTAAVKDALSRCGHTVDEVRLLATADVKASEKGLVDAALLLGLPLRIIESEEIRKYNPSGKKSPFVQRKVDLPGVAEPAALLAGRRTQLLLEKTIYPGITIAIAKEKFL